MQARKREKVWAVWAVWAVMLDKALDSQGGTLVHRENSIAVSLKTSRCSDDSPEQYLGKFT